MTPRWTALLMRFSVILLLFMLAWVGLVIPAFATPDQQIFGPKQYLRTSGAPNEYTDTITVPANIGEPFLLHIVNGQSNGQNRISSAWITVNNVQVAGPADFGQNVAIVDRTITLNPGTNQLKVRVASTPGAYLTIQVYGTKILPTPTAVTPNPLNLTVGSSGTLTATISPTPTTAGALTITSSDTGVATVPSSVAFVVNQTSMAIPVTAIAVGNAQIMVTLNEGSVSATVAVSAAPPTIASLQPATATITQGGTGNLTVTISAAQSSATTVSLTTSASSIASVPATVSVPAGQTSTSIPVSANTPGTAVMTASLNGTSATSTITVTATLPKIVSLVPATMSLNLGATGTLIVTISAVQASATPIPVTVAPTGLVTVPATITVPAGQLSTTIPVTATTLGTAMVHVSLNGTMAESAVQVTPPPPAIVSLLPSPLPVVIGANGTLTVMLNAGQLTNTEVSLTATPSSIVQVPAIVTVPAGQTSATFTVNGLAVGSATVTASLQGTTKSATVQVQPPPPVVVALLPNPLPLQQGATGSLTVTINAAQVSDTVLALSNSAATIVQAPASITVPANQLSAVIPVTALLAGSATISASINSSTASAIVQVTPPPPVVASLTTIAPDPPGTTLTRPKGKPGTLRVTLSRAPTDVTLVTLDSSATNVALVPASVTVAAGALTADVPVNTVGEGTATITASLNGGSATATVTVTPAELVLLTLSPQELTLFVGEQQPMTATATLTDGTTQNLTTDSRLAWASTNQTVATIASDGLVTALAVGASTIRATFTPTTGTPTIVETSLTVLTPPALTLTATPTTLAVGQALSVTVTSARVAGFGGLPVTITSSGTGALSHATTVTILENQTSISFVVSGVTPGLVTLTATAPIRIPGTLNLTVLPAPPTITSFTPLTGVIGTVVTITGTNLHGAGPGTTTVTFNNTNAVITSVTATTLVTTVPQGATTGKISVVTPGGTAISAQDFGFVTAQNFSLSAAPGQVTVVQGQPTTTQIQVLNNGQNPVTGFVSLAATGLPTGMSGTFTPSQIAGGQVATLTLNSGTAPTGLTTITVSATAVIDGQTIVRQSPLQVNVLAAGTATVSGRILATKDDAPIAGAVVRIGTLSATTDASGNFLLTNPPTGQQVLLVDGSSDLYPSSLPVQLTIQAGHANVLPYPVFLHEVSQNYVPIAQGGQTIVAPPAVPDFTMIIPAGTTITGWDGQPNVKVSVTPVPIDRLPIPTLPPDVPAKQVYMFNFGKPGGGFPSRPIPIIMPNDSNVPPGTRMDMWYYDEGPTPDPNSHKWKIYGQGTVSVDGKSVIPDPGVGQPKFCCGGGASVPTGGGLVPLAPLLKFLEILLGDPVLLQTGMFALEQTDMVLPGRIPVVIRRAYHSQDPGIPGDPGTPPVRDLVNSNAFGFNTTLLDYDDRLEPAGAQALFYTSGFSRERFSLQADGAYRSERAPLLAGWVGQRQQDGTSTLRDKNGTVRTFNSQGFLTALTDRNGNTVTIVRNGAQIQQILEPGGRALTFQYSGGGISQITDPLGRTVTYTYEGVPVPYAFPRLRSVTNPAGGTTTYAYVPTFKPYDIERITDARGITYLTNTYCSGSTCPPDPAVVTQTAADGGITRFNYVVTNRTVTQATVTDPRGHQSVHRFNGRSHEVVTVDGLGQQTRKTRDFTTNQVTETRDPLNRLTKFTYDLAGNVNSILDPQQNPTLVEYEPAFNRVTKITDALNQLTRFTYDPTNGNLLTVTDPLNHATSIAYNQFGQPITVTDALNHTTAFEYNEVGDLIATVDPLGNRTLRFYDVVSRLLAIVDARGKGTQFTYDNLNRVTQIQDSINGLTAFTYDPNGNLLTVTDAKNQTTTYTYDTMDRLATRKDGLNRTESYQYDLAGNLSQFTDRKNQVTTFQYDAMNRRISATYADSTATFTYDTVGRLVKASDTAPGAGTIDFAYDILNRLIQETTPQGSVAYQYDVLGRRTQMTANGQQPTVYQYDSASRLTRVEQGVLFAALGYDHANRRTSLTYPNGTSTSYTYDVASRLTNMNHLGPSGLIEALTYQYDAAGNRTALTRSNAAASLLPAAVASATYDAANEQTAFAGATLTYDANGNLTNDGVNTYQWDARNRLRGRSGPGITESYSYDPLGRRINKTINGVTTSHLYDGNDITAEIGGGAVSTAYLRSLNIDEMFGFLRQDGAYFSIYDGIGSTLALTNQSGTSAVQYSYEPFGKTQPSTPSFVNPFQFTGRENDNIDLYHYRARYYQPKLQRFISEDPLGFVGTDANLYAYVGNAPTVLVDPSGLVGVGAVGSATAAGGGGIIGAAGSYTIGSGIFAGGQQGVNIGSFQSVGGFTGGPGFGPSYPSNNSGNSATGGYVGGGVGGFITNANSPADLIKTTTTIAADIGLGLANASIQLSLGNGIWILAVVPPSPLSAGIGTSVTTLQTNTSVISCISLSRRKC